MDLARGSRHGGLPAQHLHRQVLRQALRSVPPLRGAAGERWSLRREQFSPHRGLPVLLQPGRAGPAVDATRDQRGLWSVGARGPGSARRQADVHLEPFLAGHGLLDDLQRRGRLVSLVEPVGCQLELRPFAQRREWLAQPQSLPLRTLGAERQGPLQRRYPRGHGRRCPRGCLRHAGVQPASCSHLHP